jgi:hypothetical protein
MQDAAAALMETFVVKPAVYVSSTKPGNDKRSSARGEKGTAGRIL